MSQDAAGPDPRAPWLADFQGRRYEWRRLSTELVGTFLLVLAAAGASGVGKILPDAVPREVAVAAPGLTVGALILAVGKASGAHFNPVITVAFALRRDFRWRRVPGYLLAQLAGALTAGWLSHAVLGTAGLTRPQPPFHGGQAFVIESVLTFGLVTVVLGTASSAQNVGDLSALGVGGYLVAAGLWADRVSGASMNPARSAGPALVELRFPDWPAYVVAPLVGAVLAVGVAWVIRGPGGDPKARQAAGDG